MEAVGRLVNDPDVQNYKRLTPLIAKLDILKLHKRSSQQAPWSAKSKHFNEVSQTSFQTILSAHPLLTPQLNFSSWSPPTMHRNSAAAAASSATGNTAAPSFSSSSAFSSSSSSSTNRPQVDAIEWLRTSDQYLAGSPRGRVTTDIEDAIQLGVTYTPRISLTFPKTTDWISHLNDAMTTMALWTGCLRTDLDLQTQTTKEFNARVGELTANFMDLQAKLAAVEAERDQLQQMLLPKTHTHSYEKPLLLNARVQQNMQLQQLQQQQQQQQGLLTNPGGSVFISSRSGTSTPVAPASTRTLHRQIHQQQQQQQQQGQQGLVPPSQLQPLGSSPSSSPTLQRHHPLLASHSTSGDESPSINTPIPTATTAAANANAAAAAAAAAASSAGSHHPVCSPTHPRKIAHKPPLPPAARLGAVTVTTTVTASAVTSASASVSGTASGAATPSRPISEDASCEDDNRKADATPTGPTSAASTPASLSSTKTRSAHHKAGEKGNTDDNSREALQSLAASALAEAEAGAGVGAGGPESDRQSNPIPKHPPGYWRGEHGALPSYQQATHSHLHYLHSLNQEAQLSAVTAASQVDFIDGDLRRVAPKRVHPSSTHRGGYNIVSGLHGSVNGFGDASALLPSQIVDFDRYTSRGEGDVRAQPSPPAPPCCVKAAMKRVAARYKTTREHDVGGSDANGSSHHHHAHHHYHLDNHQHHHHDDDNDQHHHHTHDPETSSSPVRGVEQKDAQDVAALSLALNAGLHDAAGNSVNDRDEGNGSNSGHGNDDSQQLPHVLYDIVESNDSPTRTGDSQSPESRDGFGGVPPLTSSPSPLPPPTLTQTPTAHPYHPHFHHQPSPSTSPVHSVRAPLPRQTREQQQLELMSLQSQVGSDAMGSSSSFSSSPQADLNSLQYQQYLQHRQRILQVQQDQQLRRIYGGRLAPASSHTAAASHGAGMGLGGGLNYINHGAGSSNDSNLTALSLEALRASLALGTSTSSSSAFSTAASSGGPIEISLSNRSSLASNASAPFVPAVFAPAGDVEEDGGEGEDDEDGGRSKNARTRVLVSMPRLRTSAVQAVLQGAMKNHQQQHQVQQQKERQRQERESTDQTPNVAYSATSSSSTSNGSANRSYSPSDMETIRSGAPIKSHQQQQQQQQQQQASARQASTPRISNLDNSPLLQLLNPPEAGTRAAMASFYTQGQGKGGKGGKQQHKQPWVGPR